MALQEKEEVKDVKVTGEVIRKKKKKQVLIKFRFNAI